MNEKQNNFTSFVIFSIVGILMLTNSLITLGVFMSLLIITKIYSKEILELCDKYSTK